VWITLLIRYERIIKKYSNEINHYELEVHSGLFVFFSVLK